MAKFASENIIEFEYANKQGLTNQHSAFTQQVRAVSYLLCKRLTAEVTEIKVSFDIGLIL